VTVAGPRTAAARDLLDFQYPFQRKPARFRPRAGGGIRVLPEEEMMSFTSRDLMVDVLPGGRLRAPAQPGLDLCGQVTAGGGGGGDDEDEDLECTMVTATGNEPKASTRPEVSLALLQRQLRETLAASAR
jgi:hypothetical protein